MDETSLARVLEVSRRMAETRALAPLLNYAMTEAIDLVGAEHGYLVLNRPDGTLDFRVKIDKRGNELADSDDQISSSILRQVTQTGEPLLIQDALSDPTFGAASSVVELKLRSVMCVPVIAQGIILGAIYVENRSVKGMFEEDHITALTIFANQAAVAVENALLNDHLEQRVAERTEKLKLAVEQLEYNWAQAQQVNEARTLTLGNIAHDIRSPLVVASSALHLFLDGTFGTLSEEQTLWLTKSNQAVDHAMELIKDVFDLARLEMGQFSYEPEPTDTRSFLLQLYEVGLGLPWVEGVEFIRQIPDDLPVLTFDRTHIRRVVFNLLSNAAKFTTRGQVRLYAEAGEDQDRVIIGVADSGEGIPPEKMAHIFERFSQVDENPTRRKLGTGLGLAICRELVELDGGQIWVEAAEEGGADFRFSLPISKKR